METDAIKKFILQIPFFKGFNDNELNKLVGREKVFKDCKKGGYIFKEGDPGTSLFVLLFGELDLVKNRWRRGSRINYFAIERRERFLVRLPCLPGIKEI